jgi:hypothetical protein
MEFRPQFHVISETIQVSPDNDALILSKAFHLRVAIVADGEDVRRQFADFPLPVHFNLLGRVNGQNLVGIDGHQNRTGVSLLPKNQINN